MLITAALALILIASVLLSSANAATPKLIVRVSYSKTLTVPVGGKASVNLVLTPQGGACG